MIGAETLRTARAAFPHTADGRVYLNHAATSPLSRRVVEAVQQHLRERSCGAIDTYHSSDLETYDACRRLVARMINAPSPERIALISNTSDGINIVAAGLPWRTGDRILLHEAEFPANVYPYLNLRRHGVEIDLLRGPNGETTPELVERALTLHTRLFALSAVQFLHGYRADLAAIGELCHRRGVVLAIDGIQAVGAVQLDVQRMQIDALAAGAQKWLMSPHGSGFLYVSEELQEKIRPSHLGWLSVEDPFDFFNYDQPLSSAARRFEGGTRDVPSIHGMTAALLMLTEIGPAAIEHHILDLTRLLIESFDGIAGIRLLTPRERTRRAGIVTIGVPDTVDARQVFESIRRRNLTISLRDGKLRYSPHFYNSPEEIALAVDATHAAIRNSRKESAIQRT